MFTRRPPRDAAPLRRRIAAAASRTRRALRAFGGHQGGQIAIIFAVSALTLVTAVGAGIDLSRTFVARQQLSHAASLTCQYSARPSVVATAYKDGSGTATYIAQVNSQAASFVTAQSTGLTQTNSTPFSYAMGGSSSVNMAASVPTFFMGLVGVQTLPVAVTVTCANGMSQANDGHPSTIVSESFENSACTGQCWSSFAPSGRAGVNASVASSTPTNTPPTNYGYTGTSGAQWTIMGYCLEVDHSGVIKSTVADGNYSAELDCDNGSGSAGNSSISTRNYLEVGTYEVRYNYTGRIKYSNYSPTYICGSTDDGTYNSDLGWANDNSSPSGAVRTNQINVYLDKDTSTNVTPPTHRTIDGTQSLAGANLIDECVYSDNWIERSVKINVTTAGYYWLSFAADGANDSYGGQLDNIRMCKTTCSGTVADNFPGAWTTTPLLFEDTFDNPTRSNPGNYIDTADTLYASVGTSGTSSSGWPSQAGFGWALSGYNQVNYDLKLSYQGAQSIGLDAIGQSSNRSMTRYFYFVPGYYQVDYNYISDGSFNGLQSGFSVCAYPPSSTLATSAAYGNGSYAATHRITGASLSLPVDSNVVAVLMSNSQVASHPNLTSTYNVATTYTNPDGTQTSTPAVAPDSFTYSTYTGSNTGRNAPVLDECLFSNTWIHRTTYVQITKPGQYWLTIAGAGTADNVGGVVDDVKVTAVRSLYGTAPSFYVTIPTKGPTPGSAYAPATGAGYTFTADPLTP